MGGRPARPDTTSTAVQAPMCRPKEISYVTAHSELTAGQCSFVTPQARASLVGANRAEFLKARFFCGAFLARSRSLIAGLLSDRGA
jgi:hypothetical protein